MSIKVSVGNFILNILLNKFDLLPLALPVAVPKEPCKKVIITLVCSFTESVGADRSPSLITVKTECQTDVS